MAAMMMLEWTIAWSGRRCHIGHLPLLCQVLKHQQSPYPERREGGNNLLARIELNHDNLLASSW
jgi:hypothetical protein